VIRLPFLDLSWQTESIRSEIDAAIDQVVTSGRFLSGRMLPAFEEAFAAYCAVREAVGVGSGTDAITLALEALGVGLGDEVITAANTCVATVTGIVRSGATPVLADVDSRTFTLDTESVEKAVTARTRAVVPVHLYGQCADMEALSTVARRHGLWIVEDAAHAHGAEYYGRRAGSLADAAAFSFYPTKNLGALGDAGAVLTDNPDVAEAVRLLRSHGEKERSRSVLRGTNSRLDELQAAVLLRKLDHLDEWNERRRALAALYADALGDTQILLPEEAAGRRHVYHLFATRVPDRDHLRRLLAERGIETIAHYPVPIHLQPAYGALGAPDERLRVSEELSGEVLSLPLYPGLTDAAVEQVADALRTCAGRAVSR